MGRRIRMRSGMAAVGVLAASAGLVSGCSSDSGSPGKPVAREGQSAQALLQETPDALAAVQRFRGRTFLRFATRA